MANEPILAELIDETPKRSFGSGGYGGTLLYGNRGDDIGPDGKPIAGTSGAARDSNRFQGMAAPLYSEGPGINRSQSDEARLYGDDARELFRDRAMGGVTPAQQLAQRQTQGAVNAVQSGAASIKGGAMARAAAARGATATGAQLQAQGNLSQSALAAREQADATNQYFGASTAQRGADLGLATDQAKLNSDQRSANDQRDDAYEGLSFDTQKAALNSKLGRTAADVAADAQARSQATARDATTNARQERTIGAVTGAVTGAAQAYGKTQAGGAKPQPDPYSTSDPRSKTAVRDVSPSGMATKTGMRRPGAPKMSDAEAARLQKQGEGIASGWREAAGDKSPASDVTFMGAPFPPKSETKAKPKMSDKKAAELKKQGDGIAEGWREAAAGKAKTPEYEGHYLGSPFPSRPDVVSGAGGVPRAMSLDDAIGQRVAQDKAEAPTYGYFDEDEGGSMKAGYADRRKGQAGYMFGGAPEASYEDRIDRGRLYGGRDADSIYGSGVHEMDDQPGGQGQQGRRDIAMSDPAAKQEAYALGRAHQWEQGKTGKPVEWAHEKPKDIEDHGTMTGDRGKVAKAGGKASGKAYGRAVPPDAPKEPEHGAVMQALVDAGEATGRTFDKGVAMMPDPMPAREQPLAPKRAPTQVAERPGFFGQARAMMSDPETKKYIKDSPMADANRSMAPSSYEYKPEFTPEEQDVGEENIGPMADKMKADRVAGTAIVTDPDTKMLAIDKTKGLKLVMGGLADLQRQVDKMARAR